MSLPDVQFTLGQGGLGRPLPGFDHYSIMAAYYNQASVNSAYANIGNKIYTSPQDAEADGVVSTYAEATAATATPTITNAGATNDTVVITFLTFDGSTVSLGTYTRLVTDTTVTLVATGIVAVINAGTYIHGFSATVGASGAYTITCPKRLGIYPNTKAFVYTITGTVALTNANFAGGTKSNLAMFRYQINEFFRMNPLGKLFFTIKFDASANNLATFNTQLQSDGATVANAFTGMGRQYLVYSPGRVTDTTSLLALKALRTTLLGLYTPSVFLMLGDVSGTALAAQPNTRAIVADGVSPILGQSGSGYGFELSKTQQQCIGSAGACLGTVSLSKVNQSIGEVQAFNISDGTECETAEFLDGTDFVSISTSLANQLHDYGYVFLRKFPGGFSGSYWNAGNCAITPSSDYAYIEDCRTIEKAIRNVYSSILPLLNSANSVNSDGTLAANSVAAYQEKCDAALEQMVRDGELSAYEAIIDLTAVITTTNTVPITIKLLQTPIGRNISITIGFVASL